MNWLAAHLQFRVKEETTIGLETGIRSYRLPNDCLWVVALSWNGDKLTPNSTYRWDRDGTDWRATDTSSVLSEFAISGRQIILHPSPAAGAITTSAFLTLRYLAGASVENEDALELSDLGAWAAIYKSAILYLRSHPTEENLAMIDGYLEELADFLLHAKRQSLEAIRDYAPSFRPVTGRWGGAR